MTPTETLKHEHQVINLVLEAAEREAGSIQATGKADIEKIDKMLDFFRNFADRCHHAKEEDILFLIMQKRGAPARGGPIAVMLAEHEEGREKLMAIADALPQARNGDPSAISSISGNLLAYCSLLWGHIDKEDNILYPFADRILTPEDQQEMMSAFEQIEAKEIGEGVHEKYHQIAHTLAQT